MDDVRQAGCPSVHYVPFAYNPSVHFPERPATYEENQRFASDVAFIGEGDADRLPFFQKLAASLPHLNLALYGGMWIATRLHEGIFAGWYAGAIFEWRWGAPR